MCLGLRGGEEARSSAQFLRSARIPPKITLEKCVNFPFWKVFFAWFKAVATRVHPKYISKRFENGPSQD